MERARAIHCNPEKLFALVEICWRQQIFTNKETDLPIDWIIILIFGLQNCTESRCTGALTWVPGLLYSPKTAEPQTEPKFPLFPFKSTYGFVLDVQSKLNLPCLSGRGNMVWYRGVIASRNEQGGIYSLSDVIANNIGRGNRQFLVDVAAWIPNKLNFQISVEALIISINKVAFGLIVNLTD